MLVNGKAVPSVSEICPHCVRGQIDVCTGLEWRTVTCGYCYGKAVIETTVPNEGAEHVGEKDRNRDVCKLP